MKYSQNNEQQIVKDYFDVHEPFQKTFLDIGANDGRTCSNTYALALLGWSGALVEASPRAYEKLATVYQPLFDQKIAKYELHKFALGATRQVRDDFNESGQHLGTDDVALLSTFHEKEMERFKGSTSYQHVQVNCLTWADFLEITEQKTFNFISMDIEGSELEVLPKMNLDTMQCQVICLEWNGNADVKTAYDLHVGEFEKYGRFNLIHVNGENVIYGRE
jgi:FkbM family methyltransferase